MLIKIKAKGNTSAAKIQIIATKIHIKSAYKYMYFKTKGFESYEDSNPITLFLLSHSLNLDAGYNCVKCS